MLTSNSNIHSVSTLPVIDRLHFLDKTCLYRSYEGVKRYDYVINMFYKGA